MALIAPKEIVLNAYKHCAEKRLLDENYLIAKLQGLVLEGDVMEDEIQSIISILIPPEE